VGLILCDVARSTAGLSAVGKFRESAAARLVFVVAVGKQFCSHFSALELSTHQNTQLCNVT
jgi:hypothetical protein